MKDVLFALSVTVTVNVGLGIGLDSVDARIDYDVRPRAEQPRYAHGPVAYERRRLEPQCTSIPECEVEIPAEVIIQKVAKLGMKEPDPTKLPEIQKYEEPEKQELSVNVEKEPPKVKPKSLKDIMNRKAQLDKRRLKRKQRRKTRNLFNIDDDPRARPTAFERITGRLDGSVYGKGVDQQKFDSYFSRVMLEVYKAFAAPASLSRQELKRQLASFLITSMTADGRLQGYRLKRRAKKKSFTTAAIAAVRQFMPAEGGQLRLPPPPPDILEFVNDKGFILDFDGSLFE